MRRCAPTIAASVRVSPGLSSVARYLLGRRSAGFLARAGFAAVLGLMGAGRRTPLRPSGGDGAMAAWGAWEAATPRRLAKPLPTGSPM